MIDHRSFIASLPIEDRARLTEKSNSKGAIQLVVYTICIGLLIAGVLAGWTLLSLPLGVFLIFLFTLLHECSHSTVFKTGFLNRITAIICGFILVIPATWFRYFHFAHHRYTHDPENDPELATPKPTTWTKYIIHLTGIPIWISQVKTLIANALGHCDAPYIPQSKRKIIATEARIMIAGYLIILFTLPSLALTVWLIPLILGQPFLRLYLLAEHTLCPHDPDMFLNTRTTFTNRIVRFLAWNMPYHAEHHAYPNVPFHMLPELHALTLAHLRSTANGYSGFHTEFQRTL